MSRFLDKSITFSVRQVLRWIRWSLYLLVPVYLVLFFLKGWEIKMGGTSLRRSPFADRVPSVCVDRVGHGGNSTHVPQSRSVVADGLLLRDRIRESSISSLISGAGATPECFGYDILVGLHGQSAGDANFIHRWVDQEGQPVVTVHVQYHQTLQDIGFTSKQAASK